MSQSPFARMRKRNAIEPLAIMGGNPASAGAGAAALGNAITGFAEQLDRGARQDERNRAESEGREAVTRDADGAIVVKDNPFRDETARRIFTEQQRVRYAAELDIDGRRQGADLHAANPLDPAAFDAGWKGFVEGRLSETPEIFRETARQRFEALGTAHRNQIVMAQAGKARDDAATAWRTLGKQIENDALSLVQAGQMQTPAYLDRVAAYSGHLVEGVRAGIITQEQATLFSRQIADESEGLGVAAVAEKEYRAKGRGAAGIAAAEKLIQETIVGNPDSSLTPSQKNDLAAQAMGRLRDLEVQRRVEADDARTRADADLERLRLGINVDLTALDGHRRRLIAAGEPEAARRVGQTMEVSREIRGLAQQPIPDIDRVIGALDERRAVGTASTAEGMMLQEAVRIRDRKVRGLQDDALSYGVAQHQAMVGKLAPLNFADPAALQAGVTERMRQARLIAEREGVAVAPFTKPELTEIAGRADALKGDRRAQLDWFARVTAELGDERAANAVLEKLERTTEFKRDVPALRRVLEVWATGNRSTARTLWDQFNTDPDTLKLDKAARDGAAEAARAKFNEGIGAVYAAQARIGGNEAFGIRRDAELAMAMRIAEVRAARTGERRSDGGVVADMYAHRRGIEERGFAAVTFPAETDKAQFEAGLRALRQPAVDAFVAAIPDPNERRRFARAGQDATWIDRGSGYELIFPDSAAAVLSPQDGRPLRWSLDDIVSAGRATLETQRAADEANRQRARIPAESPLARQGMRVNPLAPLADEAQRAREALPEPEPPAPQPRRSGRQR
ncbi:MAG: hypothetical protein NBV67_02830 [Tagaea sp.]|nr:hypothetical protein [Tagaea sp.]